jgi:hypothetical protein
MMRPEQERAMLGFRGDLHMALREQFDDSCVRRAILADGRLAALWGVSGTHGESEGGVWLVLANWATAHPRAVLSVASREMDGLASKRVLWTPILTDDAASLRLARHLGFVQREADDAPDGMIIVERRAWHSH